VRFVAYGSALYGLKELPSRLGHREYRLLRALADLSLPVVEVVGLVTGRTSSTSEEQALEAVLITRHLEYSLPYRALFSRRGLPDARSSLLDALVQLLVRLHLKGFFWGDCSLSNVLFRRDAGGLAAYLVDAETGELHPELTDGQRVHDLAIAEENIGGDLADLLAAAALPEDIDPLETAAEVIRRYQELWSELTRQEVFGLDERYRIDARLSRLNELGFDVEEVELVSTEDRYRLSLQPRVVEPGHYRRRLMSLAGLDVQENQARRLLNDIAGYRAHLECVQDRGLPEQVAAYRWLTEIFEPTIDAVPANLRERLEPAEVFHQVLEHRWFLSEAAGRDVGMKEAVASYIDKVLPYAPEERAVLPVEALDVDG
jgi:tRNA A-37 threonylcarbamoyl transferase component Bud32